MTKEVEKLMKSLDITEQEALQLIEDDKRIDKGEKLFELTKEQQKASKDADAPINKIADYVINGTVEEVVPKLIKYYKQNSK